MKLHRVSAIVLFVLMVFPMFDRAVSAHHSIAGYEKEKIVELRGVVAEYIWRNPHVVLIWSVKDNSGKAVQWSGEMNSPTSMIQVGMNNQSLKRGDQIILTVNPSLTGNPLGVIRKITTMDGKTIVDRFTPQ